MLSSTALAQAHALCRALASLFHASRALVLALVLDRRTQQQELAQAQKQEQQTQDTQGNSTNRRKLLELEQNKRQKDLLSGRFEFASNAAAPALDSSEEARR